MATVIIMASAIQTRIIQRIGKLTINWKFLVLCFNRKVYYFSISSNNDSRMSTPGIQMASNTPTCYFDRNSSLSSNPDGLSHAVNQENLRLHQIVHEYKVRYLCVWHCEANKQNLFIFVLHPKIAQRGSTSEGTALYEISTLEAKFMPMQ